MVVLLVVLHRQGGYAKSNGSNGSKPAKARRAKLVESTMNIEPNVNPMWTREAVDRTDQTDAMFRCVESPPNGDGLGDSWENEEVVRVLQSVARRLQAKISEEHATCFLIW